MTETQFALVPVPAPKAKVIENEYTPLVKQLADILAAAKEGDAAQELRGAFDSKDAADLAKKKFQDAARGQGFSGLGKIRDYDEDIDGKPAKGKVILGLSIVPKITRNRKKADETTAE